MAIQIKETFNNKIEDCYMLTSDNNKKIREKTNGVIYNEDIYIVARRFDDYEESEEDREIVEEIATDEVEETKTEEVE